MRTFSNDGLTFDVRDAGPRDGEVVVLLHGFPQDASAWDGIVPALNEAGYRTLAPDQRGYSPRARPPGRRAYRLDHLVADVRALADASRARRFHLVGHDWGAAVAWAFASSAPDRLATLTAVSVPHPLAFRRAMLTSSQALGSWYMGLFQIPGIERALVAGGPARFGDRLARGGIPRENARRYAERLGTPAALRAALNWYRAIQPVGTGTIDRTRVPTVFVWSTRDPAIRRASADLCGRYVDAPYRLEVLEGVSHWIPERVPDVLARLIVGHAGSYPARGA